MHTLIIQRELADAYESQSQRQGNRLISDRPAECPAHAYAPFGHSSACPFVFASHRATDQPLTDQLCSCAVLIR
ncbi:hypothetical protein niasHS_003186 [Heterodera schachtii]|uniref:Uncharacterized protein n=1 Tax=Heterodera schachtii TaxID=97005 RepID=A0ABD2KFS2_HETSC